MYTYVMSLPSPLPNIMLFGNINLPDINCRKFICTVIHFSLRIITVARVQHLYSNNKV